LILLDTSGLIAALIPDEAQHAAAAAVLAADDGPLVLSPFVLCEADYLLVRRGRSLRAEKRLLADVARGAYELARFEAADVAVALEVVRRYENLAVGLADASIVVLAARHGTDRVLTLDERHFRALRTLDGKRFQLLPTDG